MTSSSSFCLMGRNFCFDQAEVVFLRRGLQLPLVLEQRSFVDEREEFPQVEIFAHLHTPEWRGGDIRRIFYDRASLREHRAGFFVDCGGLGVLLDGASFLQAGLLLAIRGGQVFHDVQAGEGVIGVEDRVRVFAAQVVFHILARERSAAADDRELQLLAFEVLDDVLHLERGLHQQAAQADGVRLVFHGGFDDHVAGLLDAQVDDLVAVVRENDVDQVLADVVDVALYGGEHDGGFLRAGLLLHLGFEVGDGLLHHAGGIEHRRQLHLARAKQVAHGAHAVEQDVVDQVERRVLGERFFQYFFQGLLVRALADRFFAVDDGELQLVFDRQRVHVRGGLGRLCLFCRQSGSCTSAAGLRRTLRRGRSACSARSTSS